MQTVNLKRPTNGDGVSEAGVDYELEPSTVGARRVPCVTKITYTRRFNLGDYQHEEITVESVVDESTGDPQEELLAVRELVAEHCTARLRQRAMEKRQQKQ